MAACATCTDPRPRTVSLLQQLIGTRYGIEEFKLVLESIGFSDVVVSADFDYGKTPLTESRSLYMKRYESK
jgi:hypothetical protein